MPSASDLTAHQRAVLNCQYSNWKPLFPRLSAKATVIKPLPPKFIEYLQSDGFRVPESAEDTEFPELHRQIESAIKEYGGGVAPKLNWSAPRDAAWLGPDNTVKCTDASEVYILLKGSSYISHDLNEAFGEDGYPTHFEPELVLRKWIEVQPSMEFRCFVKERRLIGVVQRDMTHYEFLENSKDHLLKLIGDFFDRNMADGQYPDDSFVFDVYIHNDRVWLVDINVWAEQTDSLLYDWKELFAAGDDFPLELRTVDKEAGMSLAMDHTENRVPLDVYEAGLTEGGMLEFLQHQRLAQENSGDEDSE